MKNSWEKQASGTYQANKHAPIGPNTGVGASKPTGTTINSKIAGPQIKKGAGSPHAGGK